MKKSIFFTSLFMILIGLNTGKSTIRIACPGDINLGCNPSQIKIVKANKIEFDSDCKGAKIKIVGQSSSINPETCESVIITQYEVTNNCGEIERCEVVIRYLEDYDLPVITSCGNRDIGCISDLNELENPAIVGISATDNCGVPILTRTSQTIRSLGDCTYEATQSWIAVDQCGNSSTCIGKVKYIYDPTPPKITACPPDTFLGCFKSGMEIPEPAVDLVQVEENCIVAVHSEFVDIHLDSCISYITRYYIASDGCGRNDTCKQRISWASDNVGPIFTQFPKDVNLGCNPTIDWSKYNPNNEVVKAVDNCGEVVITYVSRDTAVDGCLTFVLDKWEAKDKCGNKTTKDRAIFWKMDTIPPVFTSCPKDIDYGIVKERPDLTNLHSGITYYAEENCSFGGIPAKSNGFIEEESGNTLRRVYSWTATDDCGNTATCRQYVTYTLDESAPEITSCPSDVNFGCVGLDFFLPPPNLDQFQWEDESPVTVKVNSTDSIYAYEGCTFVVKRTYTATDIVGNFSFCDQFIRYTPISTPIWDYCPRDLNIGCNPEIATIQSILQDTPRASSTCSTVNIKKEADRIGRDGCQVTIIQKWTGTDECDNSIECVRTLIYYENEEDPSILGCAEGINYGCVENLPQIPEFNKNDYIVFGGCSPVTLNYVDQEYSLNDCVSLLRRTIIATDGCGKQDVCTQDFKWILIQENNEQIPFPQNENYDCLNDIPPPPEYESRNCGVGVPQLLDENIGGDCLTGNCTVFRYWIKEECDNQIVSHVQTITLFCGDALGVDRTNINVRNNSRNNFTLYPNPARNFLNVKVDLPMNHAYQILIFDLSGKVTYQNTFISTGKMINTIPVDQYANGSYLIEIRSDGLREVMKWIKTN